MPRFIALVAIQALSQAMLTSADKCMSYSVATITDCSPVTTSASVPAVPTETKTVTVTMPNCHVCECKREGGKDCVFTKTYTTEYEAVCPTGVITKTYTVEEIYPGVTEKPHIVTTTEGCPPGFTSDVVTCNTCGPAAITKTVTYPSGGSPWQPQPTGGSGANNGNNGNNPAVVTAGASKMGAVSALAAAFVVALAL
ncbi:hypothetical protein VHEMI07452 [[Torrubiella] hemipterigena]|uniref:Uncharacterized protein n=1 Tax=[Torrubiella] hemipterigena TaxID=1531966 RepID=A0A0A1T3L3_9HYPO|nr:hypothetical protein VHEMI07452 [[Torrubiella] hemipterigena]